MAGLVSCSLLITWGYLPSFRVVLCNGSSAEFGLALYLFQTNQTVQQPHVASYIIFLSVGIHSCSFLHENIQKVSILAFETDAHTISLSLYSH